MALHKRILVISTLTGGLLFAVCTASANVPRVFNFQGRITDGEDEPVNLQVKFWNAQVAGEMLFSELHENVPLHSGIFSIRIGSVAQGIPDGALDASQIWLGVSVDGGPELPRTRLLSVPFAERARSASQLVQFDPLDPVLQVLEDGAVAVGSVNPGVVQLRDGGAGSPVTLQLEANAGDGAAALTLGRVDRTSVPTMTLDAIGPHGGPIIEMFDLLGNISSESEWVPDDMPGYCRGGQQEKLYATKSDGSVLTVRLDASDDENGFPCDGRIDLYDDEGHTAIRLHSDRTNEAPELSMFMGGEVGQVRETVEILANSEGGLFNTGGKLALRRVGDPNNAATTTVDLKATYVDDMGWASGAELKLKAAGGTPVFTVRAGSGAAWDPVSMELASPVGSALLHAGAGHLRFEDGGTTLASLSAGMSGGQVYVTNAGGQTTINLNGSDGRITTKILEITGADLAEKFPTSEDVKPGVLVAIDPENPGQLCLARGAYNRCVTGVVSGANDFAAGAILGNLPGSENAPPIALSGRVWCWCDASYGAIEPGDLLTTSDTAGHAMKVSDHPRALGAIVGKAMTRLESGSGLVLVLVSLQ